MKRKLVLSISRSFFGSDSDRGKRKNQAKELGRETIQNYSEALFVRKCRAVQGAKYENNLQMLCSVVS